jgi:uncharacterized protein HemX
MERVRAWWEKAGLNAGLGWVVLVAAVALVINYGGLIRDSDDQRTLAAAVGALQASMTAEQEARKLLEAYVRNLEQRGMERTARRDADIATLNGRLSTQEGKLASLQIEIAAKLAELITDVRSIKDRLGQRAVVTTPNRAG